MSINCILCDSHNLVRKKNANVEQLKNIYSVSNIDIAADIKDIAEISLLYCEDCKCGFFSPSRSGTRSFYEQLQNMSWYYPDEKNEFDLAQRYIQDNDSVLEIGCGSGNFAKYVNKEKYVGLEFTEKAVSLARAKGLSVENESIEVYSIANKNKFDVVCFYQVLEHVESPREFLKCAIDCVRPDGLLILSVPSDDSYLSFTVNNVLNMPPHHLTRWSDQALKNLTKLMNLELVCIEHELLADVHVLGYLQTIVLGMFSSKYRMDPPLLDLSFSYKLKIKIGQLIIKILNPIFQNKFFRPHGHSVTVVYRVLKS